MPTTETHADNLQMYVNDMAALEKHIIEPIEYQLEDAHVQSDPQVVAVLQKIKTTLHAHVTALENHTVAGNTVGSKVKDAIAVVAGIAAGLYDKVRIHPVSRMLRDDYTALSLTCTAYSMLHTTGLATKDLVVGNLALRHLRDLTPLVMDLSRLIPHTVVKELAEDDPNVDQSVIAHAIENTTDAWRPS